MLSATSPFRLRRPSTIQTEIPMAAASRTTSNTCSQ